MGEFVAAACGLLPPGREGVVAVLPSAVPQVGNPRLTRLLRIIKYLAVPGSLVSYCKHLLSPL